MARESKYEDTIQIIMEKLQSTTATSPLVTMSAINDACNLTEWKHVEGVKLGIRALVKVGLIKTSWNDKKIYKADIVPANDQVMTALSEAQKAKEKMEVERDNAIKQRDQALRDAERSTGIHEIRVFSDNNSPPRVVTGSFHAVFPRVLTLAKARKNIFIYGPTGCGKTHTASQVAKVLGLPFAFISCSAGMPEGKLEGRLLPIGEGGRFSYVASEFIKCYENGGVYLLDEIDAADANVLLLINAALANGHVAVPNRPEKPYAERHKDFICIAAANTVGTGADRLYSGRNKLDAATLDRFQIGKVMMDYDTGIEIALCPDDVLRKRLQTYRKRVRENRLERSVSTRFLRDAYDMKHNHGWTDLNIDDALFTGWREDEINKAKGY